MRSRTPRAAVRDRDRLDPGAVGLRGAADRRSRRPAARAEGVVRAAVVGALARAAAGRDRCSSTRSRRRRRRCRRRCCASSSSGRSVTSRCPTTVSVVAAANPPEQAADGWELSPPLANRFCHLDWPVDARTVATGFAGGWPTPKPPQLADGWERRFAVTRSWVGGVPDRPPDARASTSRTIPPAPGGRGQARAPGTWRHGCRPPRRQQVSPAAELAAVRGCVGVGPGVEFLAWLAEADLPDPEAVLADPDSFVLPERGDRAYAALTSVAAAVAADPTADRSGARMARIRPGAQARHRMSPRPPPGRSRAAGPRARRSRPRSGRSRRCCATRACVG